ncbi:hypothetical protein LSCM1_00339 [Leishmania martiniquensis]|uniref:adenylate cyclase n=1 Tax=Leishmania martiniquensis TaxID=1580590 RepID=A0A836G0Z8_9TRYP|nr:hypothetical protein LSCM1_00339 [Leishmania martiniquensis]
MWQPPQSMRRSISDSARPPAMLLSLLLLVLSWAVSVHGNRQCCSFGIGCVLLQTTGGSSAALKAADATAQKTSMTCTQESLTQPSVWAPTDGTGSELNVYMSMLSDTLLSDVVAASSSSSCTLVTSISEGVLDTRSMSKHVYFTNPDPATEMLGLLSHVMASGAPSKIGFVYASTATGGTSAGAAVYKEFRRRILELGYAGTVTLYDASQTYSAAKFEKFVSSFSAGASAIFFFPPAGSDTNAMFAQLIASLSKSKILMPSWLIRTATTQYLAAASPSLPADNVIVSSTNPHPQDPNFGTSMRQFEKDYGSITPALDPNSVEGIEAVAGWVTARATVATLQLNTLWATSTTQKNYFDALFEQRFYTIGGEIVLGGYSKSCNVGGRMVLLYSLAQMNSEASGAYYGLRSMPQANLMLKPWECHAADVALSIGKMVLAGYVSYHGLGESFTYITTQMQNTVPRAMHSAAFTSVTMGPLEVETSASWGAALDSALAIAVYGATPAGTESAQVSQVLVDPIFMRPTLYQNLSNVVYLTATNEQQLGAMSGWVVQSAAAMDVHVVLRIPSDAATEMQDTLKRITAHAGVTIASVKRLDADVALLSSDLAASGLVVLIGVIPGDIATLKKHLEDNSEARVLLLFDELTQFYGAVRAQFTSQATSFGERLLFITNLPPWAPKASQASQLSASFIDLMLGPDFYAPASMRGYLAVRVLSSLTDNLKVPTSGGLLDALYMQPTLQVDDLTLGPFQRTGCAYSVEDKQVKCTGVVNGGASEIHLWSYSGMITKDGEPIAGPYLVDLFGHLQTATGEESSSDTTMETAPEEGNERRMQNIIIVVAAFCFSAAAVAVAVAVIVCVYCSGDSRDNSNAPKDERQPLTLIFTDIESSTALWSTAPQAMAFAVALHHKLARQLIIKYKCYEVKTIGDSFMIACKEPFVAMQLARDLELALYQADWGSAAIDEAYALLGKPRSDTALDDCKTSPWNGLRVRAGIHRGLAEVRFDEVTKGYDYYGNTVNIAARTESISCGGQVICTSSVVEALTEEEQKSIQLLALGAHQLRGVAEPIEMYEMCTVPGRVFPSKASGVSANPLAPIAAGTGTGSVPSSGEDRPMCLEKEEVSTTEPECLKPVVEVLDVYFSAYTSEQKIKCLLKACKFLSLSNPPRCRFTSKEAYAQSLMIMVATRTSAVIDFRHRMQERSMIASAPATESKDEAREMKRKRDAAVESPAAVKMRRRCSISNSVSGEKPDDQESSENAMVLVIGKSDLLALQSSSGLCCDEKSAGEDRAMTALFLNGAPSVSGDEVSPCFQEGNGLLFRVIDKKAKQWAFYNDTTNIDMHVHFSVGRNSAVEWGPSLAGRVTQEACTGWYEGELLVPPLGTQVLLTGDVSGYRMRYSTTLFSEREQRQLEFP